MRIFEATVTEFSAANVRKGVGAGVVKTSLLVQQPNCAALTFRAPFTGGFVFPGGLASRRFQEASAGAGKGGSTSHHRQK
jgi:hypothetical protein